MSIPVVSAFRYVRWVNPAWWCSVWLAIVLVLMVMAGATFAFATSQSELPNLTPARLASLLNRDRQQQVVVVLRHAERCDRSSHPCLGDPHGITRHGKQQAMAMGKAWRLMVSRPYRTMTGSAIRTRQSAREFSGQQSIDVSSRLDSASCKRRSFRSFLDHTTARHPGLTVMFSHSGCLSYMARYFANKNFSPSYLDGVVLVIQPDGVRVVGAISHRLMMATAAQSVDFMRSLATVNK